MTDGEKRKPGRPRKYSGTRPTWTVRLSEHLGQEVVGAARENGRSISEEIEHRVSMYNDLMASVQKQDKLLEQSQNEIARIITLIESKARSASATAGVPYEDQISPDLREELRWRSINSSLEQIGFTKLEVGEGEFVWVPPGQNNTVTRHEVRRARFIEAATPLLKQALTSALADIEAEIEGGADEG